MSIVIVRPSNKVNIDGEGRLVDLSSIDPDVRVVRFDPSTGEGEIEHVVRKSGGKGNVPIDDLVVTDQETGRVIHDFQQHVTAWESAPPFEDGSPADPLEIKRRIAERVLSEEQLEKRAAEPDAPPEVKDYIADRNDDQAGGARL